MADSTTPIQTPEQVLQQARAHLEAQVMYSPSERNKDAMRATIAAIDELLASGRSLPAAVPTQQHVEGFLCRAWGETDLPEARLVRTREEWEAFVVVAQWGSDATYASLDADDREMVDAQIRYIAHDMADNNEGQINFEIGGVSVERVTFAGKETA